MALITPNTHFDADAIEAKVVGIAADVGQHDSGLHQHQKGQLLYAPHGCITLTLEQAICILPPTKAVWIPPGTMHRAQMTNVVAYRSVYFDVHEFECPIAITTVDVDELLKALINRMALWEWDIEPEQTTKATELFWQEFYSAQIHSLMLALPQDRRLTRFRQQIAKPRFLPPSLSQLAEQAGASSKTISRIFKAETGMNYQDWRQQWRLMKAIELLATPLPVAEVAHQLDFSSDSAFIAFFKQQTGKTPLAFSR